MALLSSATDGGAPFVVGAFVLPPETDWRFVSAILAAVFSSARVLAIDVHSLPLAIA